MDFLFANWQVFKWVFLAAAVLSSGVWGYYGVKVEAYEDGVKAGSKHWVLDAGKFISEFTGSFAGWGCLFLLLKRLQAFHMQISSIDLFLILGAFIGIAGYSYYISSWVSDWLHKKPDTSKPQ